MRFVYTALFSILMAPVAISGSVLFAVDSDEAGVREAVGQYLRGQATGDGEYYRKVFHPEAKLFAFRDGAFWQLTSGEYIDRAPGEPAEDEALRRRYIESIDIAGTAATVKVILDYPQARYTDFLSLLKIDGDWKIVNKTFHLETK